MEFLRPRRECRQIDVGGIKIGGGAPIVVQSMLNVLSSDIEGNIKQAKALEAAGCQIIRIAISSMADIDLIYALKEAVKASC